MTRKETIAEGIDLYLGDCREILPTLERAAAPQPVGVAQATPWWKILADNWRGRNGNSTTGDSVRNSCADELEKCAARASPVSSTNGGSAA